MIKFLFYMLLGGLGCFAFFGDAILPSPTPPQNLKYEACITFKKDSCMCDHENQMEAKDTLRYLYEHPFFNRWHERGRGKFFVVAPERTAL